jgi:integrase
MTTAIKRISYDINPKIWIGIKWLSTYISMRPGELVNLKEGDININLGALIIPHPKEKKPKMVFLNEDDIELLKNVPRGLPDLPFFRHPNGISGCKAGKKFGAKYFYKWWKKACKNLGIENLDLYGGTRHSTATALGDYLSKEDIKAGTLHSTNKAFERYFQGEARKAKRVYQKARDIQRTYNQKSKAR